jgi:hypothetical protein
LGNNNCITSSGFANIYRAQTNGMSMRDVFSFGWHSHWHLKAFERDEVIDFYDGDGHWSLLHAYKDDLRKGYPIFSMKGSLAIRAGGLGKKS